MGNEIQIDIWRCLRLFIKNRWRIAVLALAVFVTAYLVTMGQTDNLYSAVSTVYSTAEGGYNLEMATQTSTAMQRYAQVARSLKVLNRAAELMGAEGVNGQMLSGMITVGFSKDSSILDIRAVSPSPMLAISAANAVAAAFVSEITTITGRNNAQVLDVAVKYSMSRNGATANWKMRALAVALAVGAYCTYIVLTDIFSRKIHSVKAAGLGGDLEILGVIPDIAKAKRRASL